MSFYPPKENKYQQLPDRIIDLHGFTTSESKAIIDELLDDREICHLRLIVGKGMNSSDGPILPNFIKTYLNSKGINFQPAKMGDGGEGALEVFFNKRYQPQGKAAGYSHSFLPSSARK